MNTEEQLKRIEIRLEVLQATLDAGMKVLAAHSPLEAEGLLVVVERERRKLLFSGDEPN